MSLHENPLLLLLFNFVKYKTEYKMFYENSTATFILVQDNILFSIPHDLQRQNVCVSDISPCSNVSTLNN